MLTGDSVVLRPVRGSDLDELYALHIDIDNRGEFFPRGITSRAAFDKQFHENSFWDRDEGMLVITSPGDEILGHIEFFKTVNYLDEYELSYQVYSTDHRRKGVATQAVNLLVRYLFETKRMNRIRLVIHPDNAASRGLAEKCGFRFEGINRGAWFNKGRHHDVAIYAVLRDDVITEAG